MMYASYPASSLRNLAASVGPMPRTHALFLLPTMAIVFVREKSLNPVMPGRPIIGKPPPRVKSG